MIIALPDGRVCKIVGTEPNLGALQTGLLGYSKIVILVRGLGFLGWEFVFFFFFKMSWVLLATPVAYD